MLYGVYTSTIYTVAAGATQQLDWVYGVGDHVLDLTDPFNPTVTVDGLYWANVAFATNTLGWNADRQMIGRITGNSTTFAQGSLAIGVPNALGNIVGASGSVLVPMYVGDTFVATNQNGDTANRNLYAAEMYVVRVGTI